MATPIVLIHGLFGSLNDPKLLAAFDWPKVHAVDLLGYSSHRGAPTDNLSLQDQADHVAASVRALGLSAAHLVGHSAGGAVAALVARTYPALTRSITSVEGNFTLKDAFWTGQIAKKPLVEVAAIVDGYRADPEAWIGNAGVPLTDWTTAVARAWLDNQPASTILAQARAVVAATGRSDYLETIRHLLASKMPVHLIAGARSRAGWDVPDWVQRQSASYTAIPDTGHFMMLEDPPGFAAAVCANLS